MKSKNAAVIIQKLFIFLAITAFDVVIAVALMLGVKRVQSGGNVAHTICGQTIWISHQK